MSNLRKAVRTVIEQETKPRTHAQDIEIRRLEAGYRQVRDDKTGKMVWRKDPKARTNKPPAEDKPF